MGCVSVVNLGVPSSYPTTKIKSYVIKWRRLHGLKDEFFFLTLMPKKIPYLTPYEYYSPKWPTFIFCGFFLSFFPFPPFETAGMSPLPWHLSTRDRRDRCDYFFSLPPFEMAGLNFLIFFRFFVFFGK